MDALHSNQTVLIVLLFSSLAAGSAALGVLPFRSGRRVPLRAIGLAYGLASGLMLGAGYILMAERIAQAVLPVIVGAGLGVGYTYLTHRYSAKKEMGGNPDLEQPNAATDRSIKIVLLSSLHSASEGVAIGVAMAVSLRLGVFLALVLAVHNIAEAMVLTDVLRSRRVSLGEATGMSIVTNVPQILLAIVAFAITPAIPGFLPWALGFAAGALVYLVLTELLPYSYERSGRTGIAVLVSVTSGAVILLKGFLG